VRWPLALSSYDFEVQYKPGRTQKVVDALSHLPMEGTTVVKTEDCAEDITTLTLDIHPPPSPSNPRLIPMVNIHEQMIAVSAEEVLRAQDEESW
jgi:hypothetical protein